MQSGPVTQGRWERLRTLPGWVGDVLIVAVGGASTILSVSATSPAQARYEEPDSLGYLLVAAIVLPYLVRRRYPFAVLSISSSLLVVYVGLDYNEAALPTLLLVGVYTVGNRCSPTKIVAAFVLLAGGLTVLYLDESRPLDLGDSVGSMAFYAVALMVGWTLRSRRERLVALEERAQALEREKEEQARRAVVDERLRIAQELHDVMAHSMSVIAVQAGAGMHVIEMDPTEARRALENISNTSRSTLTELRRLLGVLRDDDGGPNYTPAPGLSDLGRLGDEMEAAGIHLEMNVPGGLDLPAGVDLTAFRIVQEALTNVLKHAGPANVVVDVTDESGVLRIEVRDDGRGVNGRSDEQGHGLMGMRERVAVYGGALSASPITGGGFRVMAILPWTSERLEDAT